MTEQESEILKAIAEGREIKTRDGKEVRIYAMDGEEPFGVHGAIKIEAGWVLTKWDLQGRAAWSVPKHPNDLIVAPRSIEVDLWVNVYGDRACCFYSTKEQADKGVLPNRFACINIKRPVKEGEGL